MSTSRFASLSLALLFVLGVVSAQTDPGVQSARRGTGATIIDPSNDPNGFTAFFSDGLNRFQEVETVSSSANTGLGPRFSSNQCKGDQRCEPYVSDGKPAVGTGILLGRTPHITARQAAESAVHWRLSFR